MLMQTPSPVCHFCEQREAHERELCEEEETCLMHVGSGPVCRELQVFGTAEWRAHQEQDADLEPVLQWVEAGWRPPWDEVAGSSTAIKGLWATFEALCVREGVLQRALKKLATREQRWQVGVPRDLRETVLKASQGYTWAGHFGVSKTFCCLRQGFYKE